MSSKEEHALQRQRMSDDPSGGGIMEALNRLVESALFPDAEAPALAPAAAAAPAADALPGFEVRHITVPTEDSPALSFCPSLNALHHDAVLTSSCLMFGLLLDHRGCSGRPCMMQLTERVAPLRLSAVHPLYHFQQAMLPAQAPQALASQQAPDQENSLSEQAPDAITEVEVQQSAADPDIEEVHVRVLTPIAPVSNEVTMRCCGDAHAD
jgi:hypothetical protein